MKFLKGTSVLLYTLLTFGCAEATWCESPSGQAFIVIDIRAEADVMKGAGDETLYSDKLFAEWMSRARQQCSAIKVALTMGETTNPEKLINYAEKIKPQVDELIIVQSNQ